MRYELKNDVRSKCRPATGGNRLDALGCDTSSSLVKNSSARLLSLMTTATRLQVAGSDVENKFINAPYDGKEWAAVGSKFGDEEDTKMLMKKDLHGLKTSGRKSWELLEGALRKSFSPLPGTAITCGSSQEKIGMIVQLSAWMILLFLRKKVPLTQEKSKNPLTSDHKYKLFSLGRDVRRKIMAHTQH